MVNFLPGSTWPVSLLAEHLWTCSGEKGMADRVFPLMYRSLCKQLF